MATNNKCKKCGCKDSFITSPAPCPTPNGCPDPQPCSEVFDSQCVIYTGEDLVCNGVTIVSNGTEITQVVTNLFNFILSLNPNACTGSTCVTYSISYNNQDQFEQLYLHYKNCNDVPIIEELQIQRGGQIALYKCGIIGQTSSDIYITDSLEQVLPVQFIQITDNCPPSLNVCLQVSFYPCEDLGPIIQTVDPSYQFYDNRYYYAFEYNGDDYEVYYDATRTQWYLYSYTLSDDLAVFDGDGENSVFPIGDFTMLNEVCNIMLSFSVQECVS